MWLLRLSTVGLVPASLGLTWPSAAREVGAAVGPPPPPLAASPLRPPVSPPAWGAGPRAPCPTLQAILMSGNGRFLSKLPLPVKECHDKLFIISILLVYMHFLQSD